MSGPSVLIIDDDLENRTTLREILELDNYRVAEAASISEALLERNWSEYLAILLDRRLSDEPVARLLPRLRQLAPDSAVIVVTAHDNIAGAIEALREGAVDYLLKPIDPVQLRSRLGRIADYHRLEQERRESDRFARSVLDSLGANVAVLDDRGTIVAVNLAWREFAAANGAGDVNVAEGADYFDVCARATGQDAETARKFVAGIRDVLGGRQEYFELEYACHTPDRQRWFIGQVTPFHANGPARVVVAHVDITRRRLAEEALDESRRRFQAVFENSLDGILLADDATHLLDANPAMCKLLGYSHEEVLGMTAWDITPAPIREQIPDIRGRLVAEGTMSGEYDLLCKDGTTRTVDYRAVANILPGLHLTVQRDITERKLTEEALSQSEERFRFLVESIPHMVWASYPDGIGGYCNRRYSDYVGAAPEQLRGDGWAKDLHPDDQQRVFHAWGIARRDGTEHRIEGRIREARTGEYRWFLLHALPQRGADGRVVRWFGTCTDIDDRKRAEEALRDSEDRLRRLVAVMPAAVYTCDADGRITFYNRRAVELWGREPGLDDRFSGAFRLCLLDGTPLPQDRTPMARCIREGVSVEDMAIVVEQTNGTRAVVSVNIAPLIDGQGRRVGAINVFQDITERKQAEEALRESAARLQVLSRRVVDVQEEERRHIARELHDEIGQVLSAISVNLHAVKGLCDPAARPRIEESIEIVDRATQQVRNLSLDLRPSMLDDLGLPATLRWFADRLAHRAGFAVRLTIEPTDVRPPAELAVACFRAAQEALTNVVRHASAQNVWIELRQSPDGVDLTIRDDGDGFDPETARQSAARGESFGLMGIQERVELLGGRFEVRSQPGAGTTIDVRFQIAPPPLTHRPGKRRRP
jgi:PAS domain S-box-containing protein